MKRNIYKLIGSIVIWTVVMLITAAIMDILDMPRGLWPASWGMAAVVLFLGFPQIKKAYRAKQES